MRITDKYIFFWSGIYSQWHLQSMTDIVSGIKFNCSEQYMMWSKAMLFNDSETADKILNTLIPKEQKDLGKLVKGFEQTIWDNNKYQIVSNACMLKFTQNPKLLSELLNSDNKIFVEASPFDRIWGIGMREDERGVEDENNWKGENLLGYALVDTRNFIRNILLSKDNLYEIK